MREFNIDDRSGSELCNRLVDTSKRRLINLWKASEKEQKEAVMAFGVTPTDVTFTGTRIGEGRSVPIDISAELLSQLERRFRMGYVHTHPTNPELLNELLSPGDLNVHLQLSDSIGSFDTTMVLTQKSASEYTLFGFENKPGVSNFGAIQDRILDINSRFDEDIPESQKRDIVFEMYDIMEEIADPCQTTFRVGNNMTVGVSGP